ncbi:hypothetical protein CR513_45775, partial [Mucuna pruriens]
MQNYLVHTTRPPPKGTNTNLDGTQNIGIANVLAPTTRPPTKGTNTNVDGTRNIRSIAKVLATTTRPPTKGSKPPGTKLPTTQQAIA